MPVVTCPACSTRARAPDSAAASRVRCPGCQGVIEVPAPEMPVAEVVREARPAPPPRPAEPAPSPFAFDEPRPGDREEAGAVARPPRTRGRGAVASAGTWLMLTGILDLILCVIGTIAVLVLTYKAIDQGQPGVWPVVLIVALFRTALAVLVLQGGRAVSNHSSYAWGMAGAIAAILVGIHWTVMLFILLLGLRLGGSAGIVRIFILGGLTPFIGAIKTLIAINSRDGRALFPDAHREDEEDYRERRPRRPDEDDEEAEYEETRRRARRTRDDEY